jgi:hypothetical protein
MLRIFIIFSLVLTGLMVAQSGYLGGLITDAESSQPLVGANISIENSEVGAASDMDGQYVIADLRPGSYNIRIEYLGYQPVLKNNVVVRSGRRTELNIRMQQEAIENEGVEVVANYFLIPREAVASSQSIDFEEIRRAPGSNVDIQRVVQNLPSVVSGTDQVNEIITRGGNPGENLFVMDRMEIPNTNHFALQGAGGGPINAINTLMVENVDFYAGAFSSRFGDKASSVMNLTLREGSRERFSGDVDISAAGFGGIVEGPIGDGTGSYLFSARKSFLDLIISNTGLTAVPQYYNLQGKVAYDINANNYLIINGFFGDDNIHIKDQDETNSNQGSETENVRSANKQYAYGTTLRTMWNQNLVSFTTLSLVGNIWKANIYRTSSGEDYITNDSHEREYQLKSEFSYNLGRGNNLDFGASVKLPDFSHDRWLAPDTTFIYDVAGGNPEDIIGIKYIRPEFEQNESIFATKLYGYTQLRYMLTPQTEVTAGIRYDYFDFTGFNAFSPRLGIKQDLGKNSKVSFALGRHYQAPQYLTLTLNPANNDLQSYYSDQVVVGLEQLFGSATRATLEFYYKDYKNIPVDFQRTTGETYAFYDGLFVGDGQANSYGAEFFFQKKLTQNWSAIVSYSYSKSETKDLRPDKEWYPSDFDYRNVLNVVVGYKYPMYDMGWYDNMKKQAWYPFAAFFLPFADEVEWSVRYRYLGGRPYTEPVYVAENRTWIIAADAPYNNVRYPAYNRLDFRLDRRFFFNSWTMVTYIDIANVLNTPNIWEYQYNDDGTREDILQYETFPVIGVTLEF